MMHFLKANAWLALVVAALTGVLVMLVDPAPPREITLATGAEGGAYERFGRLLAERLAEDGLAVNLRPTRGSVENLDLLLAENNDVAIALVQTGLDAREGTDALQALGAVFPEPVWIFHRRDMRLGSLRELRGRRVAVGTPGSGTRPVALAVLAANGLTEDAVEVLDLGGEAAAEAVIDGEADALFLVSAAAGALVDELVHDPRLTFHGLRRRAAYEARFRQMKILSIGEGQLDLAANLPEAPRDMLAAAATLVVNDRFHPGLAPLILHAASDVLATGGSLARPGAFPAAGPVDFPLTREATHYYKYGLPFLMRYVNFWTASMFDRVIIYAIPLLIMLFPVFKVAGPLYRWQTRRRIFRWYKHLREIDQRLRTGRIRETLDEDIRNLEALQDEILSVNVPLSYTDELYELHLHVDWVIGRLRGLKEGKGAPGDGATASA